MKFTITRETLLKALQVVTNAVERCQTMPILAHILLTIKDQTFSCIGTDLNLEICSQLPFPHPEGGSLALTLPGKKLLELCRALPEGCQIEFQEAQGRVTIQAAKSKFTMTSLPAAEFPIVPPQPALVEVELTQHQLKSLIDKTVFAIPQQDVRQYLNGLLLSIEAGVVRALATDGHRLALCSSPVQRSNTSAAQVIIPRKSVLELARLLEASTELVRLQFNDQLVQVVSAEFVLSSKLISSQLPNYNKIIPQHGPQVIEVARNEFKQALIRTRVLANELFYSVGLQLANNTMRLTTNNPVQEEACEELTLDYASTPINAIFNVNYFIDILNVMATDQIKIYFKDSESAIILEEQGGKDDCLYVLMPIRQ